MTEKNDTNNPSPEEIQREVFKMFQQPARKSEPEQDSGKMQSGPSAEHDKPREIKFDLKPKEVKAHLDRFVIQQDEAKKTLAIAVCDHYNHVKECLGGTQQCDQYTKQNVIMLGPTGVGKTYLIRCIAELIGVPFVKADATKFSETGYVGGDVEDLIRELVQRADGDVELAQYGMVYLDEIDKIAGQTSSHGRDVSGYGVQRGLLKLMEETEVPLQSPMDIAGQMQSMMEFQQKGKIKKKTINTRHILFIASGAFAGLEPIIKKRFNTRQIGFGWDDAALTREVCLTLANTRDFIDFGLEPEFIGRLPVRVACNELAEEDLFTILTTSEGSIIRQYDDSFKAYGIDALFAENALRAIAKHAVSERTGARGLLTVTERVLRHFKYELPSTALKRFVVTEDVVEHPDEELEKLLKDVHYGEKMYGIELARRFEKKFSEKLECVIRFDNDALEYIYSIAEQEHALVEKVCEQLLKDYEYGLDLVKRHTGRTDFTITRAALENPKATLDAWIKESYK